MQFMFYNINMRKFFFLFIVVFLICSNVFSQEHRWDSRFFAIQTQRNSIKERDAENARQENILMQIRSDEQNELISLNKKIITDRALDLIKDVPDQTDEALRAIEKIEKLKSNILRFSQYYDALSPEIQSLTEELEEEYASLSNRTFTATSLDSHLILRCDSYNQDAGSWKAYVYSEFFNYSSLFNGIVELSYKDFFGKRNPYSGYKKVSAREQLFNNIMIADSLFRTSEPAVFAILTYRILRWKDASEYKFVPLRCEIYRTDNNTLVAKFSKDELNQSTFIMYPQVEIRTNAKIEEDDRLTDKQIAKQDKKVASRLSDENRIHLFDTQLKRRALFISVDAKQFADELSAFNMRNVKLNSIKLNMDFGLTKHMFLGGTMGYDYNGVFKKADYSFGVDFGFNATLWGVLRPYVQADFAFHTDYSAVTTVGGGVDIIFGKLLLNLNYGYNWNYDINTKFKFQSQDYSRDTLMRYHTFSAGVGVSW